MMRQHLSYMACPPCKGRLRFLSIPAEDARGVRTATLVCRACFATYPVTEYIPRFVSVHNYASGFGLQWAKHARTKHDSYTGVPISKTRFFEATRWPSFLPGQTILEVGSGSGRFTAHAAATGAMVVSIDISNAVESNYALN